MLYETAARASEILALNVEDLDLTSRTSGPLFLAARKPVPARRRGRCVRYRAVGVRGPSPARPHPGRTIILLWPTWQPY